MLTRQQRRHQMRSAGKRADLAELMTSGAALHRAGRFAEAAQHYEQVLAQDPKNADALNLLGVTWHQRGEPGRAIPSIAQALALKPDSCPYHVNLGTALAAAGRVTFAIENFRRAIALMPDAALAHRNLGSVADGGSGVAAATAFRRAAAIDARDALARLGIAHALKNSDPARAAAACRAALRIAPGLAEAEFVLAALEGRAPASGAPGAYVRTLFDKYAAGFDRDLVEKLGYSTPELLAAMLEEVLQKDVRLDVVDLGCGTGLAGLALRACARLLVGIDLSPAMLRLAAERGIYHELIEGDLLDTLGRQPAGRFDLAVASDVVNYLGDLAPLMAALQRVIRPGGHVAFSTENADGSGYRLHQGLRYAHGAGYVEETADASGFALLSRRRATLRRQGADEVQGDLFLLRARAYPT